MPTILGTDLFDHAVDASYYTAGFVGSPQQDLSIVHPNDPASLLISTTVAAEYVQYNLSGGTMTWAGFHFRAEAASSAGGLDMVGIFGTTSGEGRFLWDETSKANAWALPSPANFPNVALSLSTWYWAEMIFDTSASTFHTYWRIGQSGGTISDQTTANSASGQTSNNIVNIRLGPSGSTQTGTARISRFMWGTATNSSDWYGEPGGGTATPDRILPITSPLRW